MIKIVKMILWSFEISGEWRESSMDASVFPGTLKLEGSESLWIARVFEKVSETWYSDLKFRYLGYSFEETKEDAKLFEFESH